MIRFTVFSAHVFTGLVHRSNDLIERDTGFTYATHRHRRRVYRFHGRDGISLYAGNLYLPAQRIAGQSQMMFHGNFSGAQRLLHGCAHQFSQPAAAIEHATPISPDSQLQIPE